MQRPYDPNPCYSCPQRVKRLEAAKPPQRINIPPAFPRRAVALPSQPILPKEEPETMNDKAKERVHSRILREKACSRGRLMNYCAVTKDEMESVTKELEAEGKIKAWTMGRSTIFTPPDAEDPFFGQEKKTAVPAEKKPASAPVARKATTPVVASPYASAISAPVGSLVAAIVVLKAQRDKLDQAISALEALR